MIDRSIKFGINLYNNKNQTQELIYNIVNFITFRLPICQSLTDAQSKNINLYLNFTAMTKHKNT